MKCIICQRPIKAKEPRTYATVKGRKVYACMGCQEAFDAYLDAHCPACGSEAYYENRSDGFVWMECDDCGEKTVRRAAWSKQP